MRTYTVKPLLLTIFFSLTSFGQVSSSNSCGSFYNREVGFQSAEHLIKNSEIDYALRDPHAFLKNIRERWAAQKHKDPKNPYQFDFSQETAGARKMVRDTLNQLVLKYDYLDALKIEFGVDYVRKYTKSYDRAIIERDFLKSLIVELDAMEASGVGYRRWNEYTFFYGAATTLSRFRETTPWTTGKRFWDKLRTSWDRLMLRMPLKDVESEYQNFKNWKLPELGKRLPDEVLYSEAGPSIVEIPVVGSLSRETLLWAISNGLAPYGISGFGLRAADGYERPPHDWRVHDSSHKWRLWLFKKRYVKLNKISETTWDKLIQASQRWVVEYINEVEKIENPHFKEAVKWYGFRLTHDEGLPLFPSSFVNLPKFPILYEITYNRKGDRLKNVSANQVKKIVFEYYLLRFLSRGTQQPDLGVSPNKINDVYRIHKEAANWHSNFWKQFEEQEKAILRN